VSSSSTPLVQALTAVSSPRSTHKSRFSMRPLSAMNFPSAAAPQIECGAAPPIHRKRPHHQRWAGIARFGFGITPKRHPERYEREACP
jgi:hypothetical protein